jgi:hypothetical protein
MIAKVPIRRREGLAEIGVQEAMDAFWNSKDFILCTLRWDSCLIL